MLIPKIRTIILIVFCVGVAVYIARELPYLPDTIAKINDFSAPYFEKADFSLGFPKAYNSSR